MITSRQIIASKQRLPKGAYHMGGFSKKVEGLVVKIEWTSAPTVKITTKKKIVLEVMTMHKDEGTFRVDNQVSMSLPENTSVVFVESEIEGYYYVVCEKTNRCTCEHARCKYLLQQFGECKHIIEIKKEIKLNDKYRTTKYAYCKEEAA